MEQNKPKVSDSARWIAGGGLFSGLFAMVGASCCVLPIVLVNLGLSSGLVANIAFFARAKPWFMGATLLFVLTAFVLAFRGGTRPRKWVLVVLTISTGLAAGAYVFPYYEGEILRWMNNQ